jgi:hypothetical protein
MQLQRVAGRSKLLGVISVKLRILLLAIKGRAAEET